MRIFTFDTTLRDGTQGEAVSFSVEDKLIIAQKLDEFGIDYIEGGWPGSNPKDRNSLRGPRPRAESREADGFWLDAIRQKPGPRKTAMYVSWWRPAHRCLIFGKTWDLHVRRALGISEEENLSSSRTPSNT